LARSFPPPRALSLDHVADDEYRACLQIEGCGATLRAKCLIIATGADYGRLQAEGRAEFEGSGVYYAATALVEFDPLAYQARASLARVLFVEGKLDEAGATAREAAELQPTAASSHRWQVFVAIQRRDGEAALREAQLEPNEGYRHFELALAHYTRGDRPAADAALAEAELIAKDRDFLACQFAEVYAWRGETNKAFEWLQVSWENHDTGLLSLLIDPLMRGLRHDARYKELLARIGLPAQL
jgi:tetratricopeptide (TPR) repeat protein